MVFFTRKEKSLLKKLNTPAKVQSFLNSLPFNFEKNGETLRSPLFTLREGEAHCFEGALLGAYILSLHGFKPYLIHLKAIYNDYDHMVVSFKQYGLWGALSKTNHNVLRYREPVYKNTRELALSYFHEYYLNNGSKTLRQYSAPFSLKNLKKNWEVMEGNLWEIDKQLDKIKHYDIIPKDLLRRLRKADKIEIEAGLIVDFKK
jgi:hypothetical protein